MSELVSVLIITRNRSDELFETLRSVKEQSHIQMEIIVLENGSDQDVLRHNKEKIEKMGGVRYLISNDNKGVSGGRNIVMLQANGTYLLEIDDDAIFNDEHCIEKSVAFLKQHPEVGILAFKIVNYFTESVIRQEYPFRDKSRNPDEPGPCGWFIGAGHIIARRVVGEIGYYRDFFPWGSEELDFSLRALNAGFSIYYFPDAQVLHKKSPKARIDDQVHFGSIAVKNRIKAAALNLPWYWILSCFTVRVIQFACRFRSPVLPIKVARMLREDLHYIRSERSSIRKNTVRKIKNLNGIIFF